MSNAPKALKSVGDKDISEGKSHVTFESKDVIGRSFLLPPEEDGQRFRAKIVEHVEDADSELGETQAKCKILRDLP